MGTPPARYNPVRAMYIHCNARGRAGQDASVDGVQATASLRAAVPLLHLPNAPKWTEFLNEHGPDVRQKMRLEDEYADVSQSDVRERTRKLYDAQYPQQAKRAKN